MVAEMIGNCRQHKFNPQIGFHYINDKSDWYEKVNLHNLPIITYQN